VRRAHFDAFAPVCPRCVRAGERAPLEIAALRRASADGRDIFDAVLHCPRRQCRHEYPVIDGLPVIVPDLRRLLIDRGIELLLRTDLDPVLESLIGDAIGPDSWLDAHRQTLSTYGWDGYADLDPEEAGTSPRPGAAVRCLDRLGAMAPPPEEVVRAIDAGCGAGRTAFTLACDHPAALVLGIDVNLGLLRLARSAADGRVSYPRRRGGLIYDRRSFPVDLAGAGRVDFWACDALALPFAPAAADLVLSLNLFDSVPDPPALLQALARVLRPGGRLLLGTPFDWSTRATPVEAWVGGHSQRADDAGEAISRLRRLFGADIPLDPVAEDPDWPWQTRLHDRATVLYRCCLLALDRKQGQGSALDPPRGSGPLEPIS
jgi:SAM-dependent methyltransferase